MTSIVPTPPAKLRIAKLEKMNERAKAVISLTKYALTDANNSKKTDDDTAHINTLTNIIAYWEQHCKVNNYEKLLISTIISENTANIIKIAPNLRAKYIQGCAEIYDLHSQLTSDGKINGFDEYSYINTCAQLKKDVNGFIMLCDVAINHLE